MITHRRFSFWLAIVALLFLPVALRAHNAPGSAVFFDLQEKGIAVELGLPLSELEIAFHHPLSEAPEARVTSYSDALRAYLLEHIRPVSRDGQAWTVRVQDLEVARGDSVVDLVAKVWMQPPPGASARSFLFNYDVIGHEVVNHVAIVSLRSDWNNGLLAAGTEIVGTVRYLHLTIDFNRNDGSTWRGFRAMVALGMKHIAEGTDHLLFLLTLLLPAPLLARRRRWSGYGGFRHALTQLAKIVSAFTVGHSLTLMIGAAGWVRIPSQPIEILIAVSIFVSALHAWRPIFPGKELFIAGSFGLVHGMAFAAVLSDLHLSPWRTALGIFGFNLGIECVQLAIIAVTIPWLVLLSRTVLYTPLKMALVVFAATASVAWMGERAFGWTTPVTTWIELAASNAKWLLLGLAFVATFAQFRALARRPARNRSEVLRYYL